MQKLANDFDAFKVHHAWRRSYRLLQYNPDSWHVNKQNEMLMACRLCAKLHELQVVALAPEDRPRKTQPFRPLSEGLGCRTYKDLDF